MSRRTAPKNRPDDIKENRHILSEKGLSNSAQSYAEDSSWATRSMSKKRKLDDADTHHSTRHSDGIKPLEETADQLRPNDAEERYHFRKKKVGSYFTETHPSGKSLSHGTSKSAEDEIFTCKQSSDIGQCREVNHTLIHSLPYPAEGVEVVYTSDPVEVEAWLRNNVVDCFAQAVGFDTSERKRRLKSEKKGENENKTAVLQLAVESSCLVYHLYNVTTPPKVLASVLSDEKISKIGSEILQVAAKVKKDTGLKCFGLVDTKTLAKSLGIGTSKKLQLKSLAKRLLGIEFQMPLWVATGNWEKFPLTIIQIHCAALDAWIRFKIYQHINAMPGTSNLQDKSSISCHVCGKKGMVGDALSEHIKIHSKCKCGQFFVTKIPKKHRRECPVLSPSERHIRYRFAGEPGLCFACGKRYKTWERLREHIKEAGHVTCPFCKRLLHHNKSFSHIKNCQNFISEEWKQINNSKSEVL